MTESAETFAIALWWAKRGKNYIAADQQEAGRMYRAWSEAGALERQQTRDELATAQHEYVMKALLGRRDSSK